MECSNINKSNIIENDLRLSDYNPRKNQKITDKNNISQNISSFKDTNSTINTNFQTKTKNNSFINNLTMSNNSSSNNKNYSNNISMKKENIIQGMNNLTTFSNFDNDITNYQDIQIKNFQEQINQLKKENELLKKNIEENENKEVSEDLTHQLMDLKKQLGEYDSSIEITKSKYNEEIEKLKYQIRDYNSYIHLTYLFFHNITNNALSSLGFNIEKQNNILISIEEFQQKLIQIENFIYDILKENSNLKIKYHKLLESNNNKLFNEINEVEVINNNFDRNNISNNIVNDSYNTSGSNFMPKGPENVFENNYENFSNNKNQNLELNNIDKKCHNNCDSQGTLEIYKTLEQRLNILEKELNIQKNFQNNYNNQNQVFHTVNTKNDTIIGRIRSKSGNKLSNNNQNENENFQNEIPFIEKPKKKKKKKGHNGKISINGSNNGNNNKNQRSNSKNINRCITPIQNRKSTPNSNIKNVKYKK